MEVQQVLVHQLELTATRLKQALSDLTPSELLARPHNLACSAWQLGHVALMEALFLQRTGEPIEIPDSYAQWFGHGSTGELGASRAMVNGPGQTSASDFGAGVEAASTSASGSGSGSALGTGAALASASDVSATLPSGLGTSAAPAPGSGSSSSSSLGAGAAPSQRTDPGAPVAPSFAETLDWFERVHGHMVQRAQGDLDRRNRSPHGTYSTVGEGLVFFVYHRGYHHGKIMTLRALLGKPRLLG